jgi:glycosyltransferase involved in cell wall biosynthesis
MAAKDQERSYVLITPARNEGKFIRGAIDSMVAQTVSPVRWVIVSDASTDDTDAIVQEYMERFPWIELVQLPQAGPRDFGGKVRAFNAGYDKVRDLDYAFVGNLDGDLTFDDDHFEFLLNRFAENPDHGLMGTTYIDIGGEAGDELTRDKQHVPGACQLFRREAFEAIGGYTPLPTGGIDLLAELACRQAGWKSHAYSERTLTHYRPVGTATRSIYSSRFNYGYRDYYFGGDPLWEVLRVLNQMRHSPMIVGGLCILAGYVWGHVTRKPSPVPEKVRQFRRSEQRERIKRMLGGA